MQPEAVNPDERKEMVEDMAAAVAAGLEAHAARNKSLIGTLKKVSMQAAVNVPLTTVVLIVGFYFNSIQSKSASADENSKKAVAAGDRLRSDLEAKIGEFDDRLKAQQGLQLVNSSGLKVARDQLAIIEARIEGVKRARSLEGVEAAEEPSEELVREARDEFQAREDKEIYRAQQQLQLIPTQ